MHQIGDEIDYLVSFRIVAVRDRPSTSGKNIGAIAKGKQVRGKPFQNAQKEPWLRLTRLENNQVVDEEQWMLIDGSNTSLGVGVLLVPQSESTAGEAQSQHKQREVQQSQQMMCYVVSQKRVVVRSNTSTDSSILGYYERGDKLLGTVCETVDNWKWLRLNRKVDSMRECGFILIDGTKIGLGVFLKEAVNVDASAQKQTVWRSLTKERTIDEDLTKWLFYPKGESCSYRVILQTVLIRNLPSVKSVAAGVVRKGDILTGEKRDNWFLLTPHIDNQQLSEGKGKWILIDGTSINKGMLLERCIAEPTVKRCYMNAFEVICPDKDREKYTLEVKPEDGPLREEPCLKGRVMLVHDLPDTCKCRLRLCLKNSENVLAASEWVDAETLPDYNKDEEHEPVLDLMANLRLNCNQCSCPCYVLDDVITQNSDMTDQRCTRCGCNVEAHEKYQETKKTKKKKAEPMLVDKAIAIPKERIIRRWAKFDLPASQTKWPRLNGNFKEVVAWSDLHADMGTNMDHLRQLPESKETVLLVAGDLATSMDCIETSLRLLQEKYGAVFYVPGNHDLWLNKKDGYSSLHKFLILLELCEKLGVHTRPAFISESCAVCPMFSWYKDNLVDGFKRDMADIAFDIQTMWPWGLTGRGDTNDAQQPEIAEFFAQLNTRRIALAPKENGIPVTIISMSHFVPRQEIYPGPRRLCGVMGCREIEAQVRECGSSCHVFGHSHIACDKRVEGVRYVQHPLGYPNDWHRKVVPIRVWGVETSKKDVGYALQAPVATHGLEIVKKIIEEIESYKDKLLTRPPGRWSTGVDWDQSNIFDREKEMELQRALPQAINHDLVRQRTQSEHLEILVQHMETGDELPVSLATTMSIKKLKEHIVDTVRRGPPSQIMLTLGDDEALDDNVTLSSIEHKLDDGIFLAGISLAAPQQVSVTIRHAETRDIMSLSVLDTATIKDIREAIKEKTGAKMKDCRIVTQIANETELRGLSDNEFLNNRTELLFIGSALKDNSLDAQLPKVESTKMAEEKTLVNGNDSHAKEKKVVAESQKACDSEPVAKTESVELLIGKQVKLKINGSDSKTVLDLKKRICSQVKRGPASLLELSYGDIELQDKGALRILFDYWQPDTPYLELSASGLDLGPPKQVEVLIKHAASDDPQELRILVEDTSTIREVRSAIASALQEKSLSNVKLVKRLAEGGFMALGEEDTLNGRTELLFLGRDLPSPLTGPPSSSSLAPVDIDTNTLVVCDHSAIGAQRPSDEVVCDPSAIGDQRRSDEVVCDPSAIGDQRPSDEVVCDPSAIGDQRPSDEVSEVEVVIHIDRELNMSEKFKVMVGSSIGDLKQKIAEADPTGMSKATDIGLKMEERMLVDCELVTHALSELDLCEML